MDGTGGPVSSGKGSSNFNPNGATLGGQQQQSMPLTQGFFTRYVLSSRPFASTDMKMSYIVPRGSEPPPPPPPPVLPSLPVQHHDAHADTASSKQVSVPTWNAFYTQKARPILNRAGLLEDVGAIAGPTSLQCLMITLIFSPITYFEILETTYSAALFLLVVQCSVDTLLWRRVQALKRVVVDAERELKVCDDTTANDIGVKSSDSKTLKDCSCTLECDYEWWQREENDESARPNWFGHKGFCLNLVPNDNMYSDQDRISCCGCGYIRFPVSTLQFSNSWSLHNPLSSLLLPSHSELPCEWRRNHETTLLDEMTWSSFYLEWQSSSHASLKLHRWVAILLWASLVVWLTPSVARFCGLHNWWQYHQLQWMPVAAAAMHLIGLTVMIGVLLFLMALKHTMFLRRHQLVEKFNNVLVPPPSSGEVRGVRVELRTMAHGGQYYGYGWVQYLYLFRVAAPH